MTYFDSTRTMIGNTPLVRLGHIDLPHDVNLYAKLELFNPTGSVKDRVGKAMVRDAEQSGRLAPGGTIIEATAGNTSLGIAFAALNKGYRVIFVVPEKFSEEKQALLRALGAQIVNTPRKEGMLGASTKADELRAQTPGAITLGQFVNPANPRVHYETTGPEINRDLDGAIDYLVAGAGSGGTYSGVVRHLKEQNPPSRASWQTPLGPSWEAESTVTTTSRA
jgi:cysteine synthase A